MVKVFKHTAMIFCSLLVKLSLKCKDSILRTDFAILSSVSKAPISSRKAQFQQNYKDSSLNWLQSWSHNRLTKLHSH